MPRPPQQERFHRLTLPCTVSTRGSAKKSSASTTRWSPPRKRRAKTSRATLTRLPHSCRRRPSRFASNITARTSSTPSNSPTATSSSKPKPRLKGERYEDLSTHSADGCHSLWSFVRRRILDRSYRSFLLRGENRSGGGQRCTSRPGRSFGVASCGTAPFLCWLRFRSSVERSRPDPDQALPAGQSGEERSRAHLPFRFEGDDHRSSGTTICTRLFQRLQCGTAHCEHFIWTWWRAFRLCSRQQYLQLQPGDHALLVAFPAGSLPGRRDALDEEHAAGIGGTRNFQLTERWLSWISAGQSASAPGYVAAESLFQ